MTSLSTSISVEKNNDVSPDDFFADPVAAAKALLLSSNEEEEEEDNNNDEIEKKVDDTNDDDESNNNNNKKKKNGGHMDTNNDGDDDDDDLAEAFIGNDEDNNINDNNIDDEQDDNNHDDNNTDDNEEEEVVVHDDDDDDAEDVEREDVEEEVEDEEEEEEEIAVKQEEDDDDDDMNNESSSSSDPDLTTATTVINGKGIWHSWTRNFSTPLLALLDLLDNAFDATSLTNPGRIYVLPDVYYYNNNDNNNKNHAELLSSVQHQQHAGGSGLRGIPNVKKQRRTTGLTIWNNSVLPIKPLQKILEVYTSLKGSNANSIGENGVGLKQGCATLSNLSFCVARTTTPRGSISQKKTVYSMGVIAYQLQTSLGCSLPSFTFTSANLDELKEEMILKFTRDYPAVGECIIQYGAMDGGTTAATATTTTTTATNEIDANIKQIHLHTGIDRLIDKFRYMNQNGWDQYDNVFGLIVDHLKHGERLHHHYRSHHHHHHHSSHPHGQNSHHNRVDGVADNNNDNHNSTMMIDQQIRVNKLLETLFTDLPKRYLHIPTSVLDVRVGESIVNFNYWQPRLVEMAQFDLQIHKTANFLDIINAKREREKQKSSIKDQLPGMDPDGNDDVVDVVESNNHDINDGGNKIDITLGTEKDKQNWYMLRVYTGFDALRVCDDKAQKTASMYIYSRQSGRLIKSIMDCRGELGLTSGGTDFCQGLTLIVDDFNAQFPLNPTKQDVAFGEQSNGETHKRNLYIWLNAAMRAYYSFYKDQICGKQKKALTDSLKSLEAKVHQLIQQSSTSFSSLADCQFTRFGNFTTNQVMNGQTIKLASLKTLDHYFGKDSRLQLPPLPDQGIFNNDKKPARRRSVTNNIKNKRQSSSQRVVDLVDDDDIIMMDDDDGTNDDDDDELYNKSSKRRSRSRQSEGTADTRKRARRSSISESKVPDRRRRGNDSDVSSMQAKIQALEDENRHLKKEMHSMKRNHEDVLLKRIHQIELLNSDKNKLKQEMLVQKTEIKQLKKQLKESQQHEQEQQRHIHHIATHDDISHTMLSQGSKGIGGTPVDAAKLTKRIKNLNSSIDVLKNENEDLKEQIKGLESTIHRKDKTIQAQRKLIDERNKEDDDDDDEEDQNLDNEQLNSSDDNDDAESERV